MTGNSTRPSGAGGVPPVPTFRIEQVSPAPTIHVVLPSRTLLDLDSDESCQAEGYKDARAARKHVRKTGVPVSCDRYVVLADLVAATREQGTPLASASASEKKEPAADPYTPSVAAQRLAKCRPQVRQ